MTATDELRRLLDERGVEWGETRDGATAFSDESGHMRWAIACGAAKCFLEVGPLTPEQAVAATLGNDGPERSNDGVAVTVAPDDYTAKLMAEVERLQAENAKLREQLDTTEHNRKRNFREYARLCHENDNLRDLVAETLIDVHEYAEKYGIEPNYDAVNAHLDNRMRELGIEVAE